MSYFEGRLKKMFSELSEENVVQYYFSDDSKFLINTVIGQKITLEFLGDISCIGCNRPITKTFFNGYCYPCLKTSPETAECVTQPEKCRAHLQEGRDIEWETTHHNRPHVVYLSNTSGVKVGVTSVAHLPMRWIDQGATEAIVIARTPNRYEAGLIEVALKQHISDKTVWQRMLTNEHVVFDLGHYAQELSQRVPKESQQFLVTNELPCRIYYPVQYYHTKVKTINLDTQSVFSDVCVGIKGQYILFESGFVFHVRKYGGYSVRVAPQN